MPENMTLTPIQVAWIGFTKNVRVLLDPQPDDRPLDQYLIFRDSVIVLVQDEKFLNELNAAWAPFTDHPRREIGDALIMELNAFSRAVEVAQATEKSEEGLRPWIRRWLGRGSTVAGSVKDIVDNLPPYAKNAITLFKELMDLFKGKD